MIEIDGSYGEGGGQILRTAIALSCVTGEPIRVFNIRKKRSNPGLRPQHLTGILSAKQIVNGRCSGARVGSLEIEFYPGEPKAGNYFFDIGTAGSISLLLQTLVPICLTTGAPFRLKIVGGTDVTHSPLIDYYRKVYFEHLCRAGAEIICNVERRGYYPRGGGIVKVNIDGRNFEGKFNLTEVGEGKFEGYTNASENLRKRRVCERMIAGAGEILELSKTEHDYSKTFSTGCGIVLVYVSNSTIIGNDRLGEKGVPAEEIGRKCAKELKDFLAAPVDPYLADHLVLWIALYGGKFITSRITQHTLTNIWVCEKMLNVKFKVDKEKGEILVNNPYF